MVVTSDSSAPLVVVGGITGNQGGSVFQALSDSSKSYRIRGISRDANRPNAQALAAKGVEMISLTIKPENKADIVAAYKGADYVFAMTDFWSDLSEAREVAEGKVLIDAAKEAGAKTFMFSGLPSYAKLTNGQYTKVLHFDGKAEIDAYGRSQQGISYVSVQPACYMQNFATGGVMAPQKGDDGSLTYFTVTGFGESQQVLIDIKRDYGLFVRAAIETGAKHGDVILAASETVKGSELVKELETLHGAKINLVEVPLDTWIGAVTEKTKNEFLAVELGQMIAVHNDAKYGYFGGHSVKDSQAKVQGKLHTLAEFCSK